MRGTESGSARDNWPFNSYNNLCEILTGTMANVGTQLLLRYYQCLQGAGLAMYIFPDSTSTSRNFISLVCPYKSNLHVFLPNL